MWAHHSIPLCINVMAETLKGPLLTRRQFLKKAAGTIGAVAVGRSVGAKILGELSKGVPPTELAVASTKDLKPAVEVDEETIADLAKIWTAGRAQIEVMTEGQRQVAEILYRERAAEVLKFAKVIEPVLEKVKPRLAAVARLTDVGNNPPPEPSERFKKHPEDSGQLPDNYFVSGHFGPQEFHNLKHGRLVRMNLAVFLALGVAESEKENRPFARLLSSNWQERYDWINAHVGRDAGRFLTGITNSRQFSYGPNSRGGVLVTEDLLFSRGLGDRLMVMLQPGVLAFRCYKPTPMGVDRVTDFAVVDSSGKPDFALINKWNSNRFLQAKYRQVYEGLAQFCQSNKEFRWLVAESLV